MDYFKLPCNACFSTSIYMRAITVAEPVPIISREHEKTLEKGGKASPSLCQLGYLTNFSSLEDHASDERH